MGARAHGIGNTSACLSDAWSAANNIGGLAELDVPTAAVSYNAIPSFKAFNRMAAVFGVPAPSGVVGISVFRFGDDLYSEQLVSLGYANKFGLASLGLKVNYLQYRAEGMGSHGAFTVSFGGIATITPNLFFGAHIININQPVINETTGETVPTTVAAGMALKLSDKLMVSGEVEKHLAYSPIIKAGIEYKALKKITFRTGLNLNPQAAFFGMGFIVKRLELSYAMQTDRVFSFTHQATVTLPFKE